MTMPPDERPSDEARELVEAIVSRWPDDPIGALAWAERLLAAAERRAKEECARLCDEESERRRERAQNPLPGDDMLQPFPQNMVQESKAVTASGLARAIRSTLSPGGE